MCLTSCALHFSAIISHYRREPSRGRSRHKSTPPTRRAQSYAPDPESRNAESTLGLPPAPARRSRSSARTKTTYKLRDDSGDAKTDVVINETLAFTIFDSMVVFETEAGDYLPKVPTSLLGLARKFMYYQPLILGSDDNEEKVNHFLKVTEEMASLLGDSPPTVTEIRIVYKLLSISLTTRDDYNNGKKGCKVLVEAFLYSLKQVTPVTLHFIILLMHCPKDKFNAEGLFCDPTTFSEDCSTLYVLREISGMMVKSDVNHLSGNNFEVFNGSRSNCNRETSYSKDGTKKFKHCATCSDNEAIRRGGLLNSFGAFLRFCRVPTLLVSFAGDAIDKLKNEINPDLFSHYAGLRSTHACNFLYFRPSLKTVEKHLASVYDRTLSSCNAYDVFVSKVKVRADKLGFSFHMPDKPLIDLMVDNKKLPFFGNKHNSVHVQLAEHYRSRSKINKLFGMVPKCRGYNKKDLETGLSSRTWDCKDRDPEEVGGVRLHDGPNGNISHKSAGNRCKVCQAAYKAQLNGTTGTTHFKSSEEFWRTFFTSQEGDASLYKHHTGNNKGKPNMMAMLGGVVGVPRIDAIFLPYQADYDKEVKKGTQQKALKKVAHKITNSKSKILKNKTIGTCSEKCDDCKSGNCKWMGKSITDLESFEKYVEHGGKFAGEAIGLGSNKKDNDDNAPAEEMEEDTGNGGEKDDESVDNGGEEDDESADNGGEGLDNEGTRRRRRRRSTSNHNAREVEVERELRENEEAQRAANPKLRDMSENDEEENDSDEDVLDTGAMSDGEEDDDVEYDETDES